MHSPLTRALLTLAVLAAAAVVVCLLLDGWRNAALFAGVAVISAGALTFRADAPDDSSTRH
ncbi:hypothetical protein [Kineococcus xinjiangensis]|uniref:hypothetical protein n=1 Tax=Kineococcus xinjiangensis TaxID=512762 RepID=UPI0011B04C58|nr:hypothetical protein [Kineococcus xinjiangensis]